MVLLKFDLILSSSSTKNLTFFFNPQATAPAVTLAGYDTLPPNDQVKQEDDGISGDDDEDKEGNDVQILAGYDTPPPKWPGQTAAAADN